MDTLTGWIAAQDPWEGAAVLLALAYLLLARRENLWCWYAAFASTLIYLVLFWRVGLMMESGLQIYYLAMAVYGWWEWRGGAKRDHPVPISSLPARWHLRALVVVCVVTAISGMLLQRFTAAAWPWADSFVTWGSLLATWMVARKILENWLWWLLIDSLSLALYLERGLYLTAALFAAYLVIVVSGYLEWRRHYREQSAATASARTG